MLTSDAGRFDRSRIKNSFRRRFTGRIVLFDDDHELLRLSPACPQAERAWRIYWEGYRDRGHDPLVGRRLTQLLHEAGARSLRVTTVFYGAVKGSMQQYRNWR